MDKDVAISVRNVTMTFNLNKEKNFLHENWNTKNSMRSKISTLR